VREVGVGAFAIDPCAVSNSRFAAFVEATGLGADLGTPVGDDYASADSAFTGRIEWVQIDVDDAAEDPDHLISPEERFRVALARQ